MSIICRACLRIVDKNHYNHIDTFDNDQVPNRIPMWVLQICVPEMDLYISEKPGICNECLIMFQQFYDFKTRCIASEEKILDYLKRNQIDLHSKINLQKVVYNEEPIRIENLASFAQLQNNSEVDCLMKNNRLEIISKRLICQNFAVHMAGIAILTEPCSRYQFCWFGRLGRRCVLTCNYCFGFSNGVSVPGSEEQVLYLSCNRCSFSTNDKDKLFAHNCLKTRENSKFKCLYCPYSSNRRYRLNHHVNSKHTRSEWFSCDACDYKTTDISSLRRHKKVIHLVPETLSIAPYFTCPYCDFRTNSETSLSRHRVSTHGPIIQYCNLCPYKTKDKSNFRKHLYVHGDKPRKCTACSYQCVSPYQLEKHFKRLHT